MGFRHQNFWNSSDKRILKSRKQRSSQIAIELSQNLYHTEKKYPNHYNILIQSPTWRGGVHLRLMFIFLTLSLFTSWTLLTDMGSDLVKQGDKMVVWKFCRIVALFQDYVIYSWVFPILNVRPMYAERIPTFPEGPGISQSWSFLSVPISHE